MFLEWRLVIFFLRTLREYRISDSPVLFLLKMICLFAGNLSFFVRIILFIFPFPDGRVPDILRVLFQMDLRTERRLRLQRLYRDQFLFSAVPRIGLFNVLKLLDVFRCWAV